MGEYGKPAEFRVNGKVNLVKSTDKKDKAGVCVEPVNVKKVTSNKKQLIRNRDDFVYISVLSFFILISIISIIDPLIIWLTNLFGDVVKGRTVVAYIILAVTVIFFALQFVLIVLYNEFDNKYAHKE